MATSRVALTVPESSSLNTVLTLYFIQFGSESVADHSQDVSETRHIAPNDTQIMKY